MSFSTHLTGIFVVILFSIFCCLDAKPTLYTNDKGVTLPIMPSALNKSWCRSSLFKERITLPGCQSKLVYNRFCYGQCTSFYVPRYDNKPSFKSCTACLPAVKEKKIISLKCNSGEQRKEITLVRSCRCRADSWDRTNSRSTKPT